MIAALALSPSALDDPGLGGAIPVIKGIHEALRERIEAHASIVVGSQGELGDLIEAVKALPQQLRDPWIRLLPDLKKLRRVSVIGGAGATRLQNVHTLEGLGALAELVDVTVVSTGQAAELGAGDLGTRMLDGEHLEIASLPMAAYCSTFKRLAELASVGHLEASAPREEFWDEVLRRPLHLSRNVTLLDRYLSSGLVHWHRGHREYGPWEPEVMVWLLEQIDRHRGRGATDSVVRFITEPRPEDGLRTADDAARLINQYWRPSASGTIERVEITLTPWKAGGETLLAHDRHLRTDIGVAVKIHAGWGRLDKPKVWDKDGMSWQYLTKSGALRPLQDAEQRCLLAGVSTRAVLFERVH